MFPGQDSGTIQKNCDVTILISSQEFTSCFFVVYVVLAFLYPAGLWNDSSDEKFFVPFPHSSFAVFYFDAFGVSAYFWVYFGHSTLL